MNAFQPFVDEFTVEVTGQQNPCYDTTVAMDGDRTDDELLVIEGAGTVTVTPVALAVGPESSCPTETNLVKVGRYNWYNGTDWI
jgi:hypothetical protein